MLLQFHDQKTVGILVFNALYVHMPARVIEKTVRGTVVIFKRTLCQVIGWELEEVDKGSSIKYDRRLRKMPLCIYLYFSEAQWTIDVALGKGVYPLHPIQRSWVFNEKNGAKVKRAGFAMVPDFAWTAFVAQGVSLPAGLADCGDVLDVPGFSELIRTYVILSPFTKADGLLLMRAFSHELFNLGPTPGPYCQLKYMRSRFPREQPTPWAGAGRTAHSESDTAVIVESEQPTPCVGTADSGSYTADDARREYDTMLARHTALRVRFKTTGPRRKCHECTLHFTAAGLVAAHTKCEEVYEKSVTPGHWRRCLACAVGLSRKGDISSSQKCEACARERHRYFFDTDVDKMCTACALFDESAPMGCMTYKNISVEASCVRLRRQVNYIAGNADQSCSYSSATVARP